MLEGKLDVILEMIRSPTQAKIPCYNKLDLGI